MFRSLYGFGGQTTVRSTPPAGGVAGFAAARNTTEFDCGVLATVRSVEAAGTASLDVDVEANSTGGGRYGMAAASSDFAFDCIPLTAGAADTRLLVRGPTGLGAAAALIVNTPVRRGGGSTAALFGLVDETAVCDADGPAAAEAGFGTAGGSNA